MYADDSADSRVVARGWTGMIEMIGEIWLTGWTRMIANSRDVADGVDRDDRAEAGLG
jgi:hypothetical protein